MDFVFEQIRVGGDRNFGYLLGDRSSRVAAAIDPSYSPKQVLERAKAQGLEIELILNTHGHTDHANGNEEMKRLTGAPIAAHPASPNDYDLPLEDGGEIDVGEFSLHALHVPGHTPDHVLFHCPQTKVAITGDHLFVGKIGGTATEAESRAEYDSLQYMLRELPDDTTIWPGHDYGCRPASTIGIERTTNPFLLVDDFDAFLELKRSWATFKASNGLK